jgi:hypothetical protein
LDFAASGLASVDVVAALHFTPQIFLSQYGMDIHAPGCLNTGADYHSWRLIMKKLSILGIVFGAALLAAVPYSVQWSSEKSVAVSLDRADAKVGRPLTATSVAGVARRANRRAYRRGY